MTNLVKLVFFAANLIPLIGVWRWGWDAFQLLMLYWAETVIVAGWALARIATLPADLLGTYTENGRRKRGTNRTMTLFFAAHAGLFILVHLFFLLVLFSGDWAGRMARPLSFLHDLFVESGAWTVLALAFLAGLFGFLTAQPQPTVVTSMLHRLDLAGPAIVGHGPDPKADHVAPLVGGLYTRIVAMQIAIIAGAWVTNRYGSQAPLMIAIVLKALFELSKPIPFTFSGDGKSVTINAGADMPTSRQDQKHPPGRSGRGG